MSADAFLLVEDPLLIPESPGLARRMDRTVWKQGPHAQALKSPLAVHVAGVPLVIYTGNVGPQAKELLPAACVFDSHDHPEQPPYVWWNSLKDLPLSKLNHISNQAFYLRRYARRVAGQWAGQTGRRPAVRATTALSLNGRPHQFLVDPGADLADVSLAWFGHNAWIRDLETARIPREAVTNGKRFIGL